MYACNFFETKILNTFSGTDATPPSALYIGLFLSSPGESGTAGTEVNYPEYTRMPISFTAPYAESGGIGVRNDAEIQWNIASADGGNVRFIGIFDSAVIGSGNAYLYGELTDPMNIRAGQQPNIAAGDVMYYSIGDFSIHLKTAMLNVLRGQNLQGFTPHMALFSGDPELTGAELSGGAYARPAVPFTQPAEQLSGQMQIQNNANVVFPAPTSVWGLWAYEGLMDGATGGSLILKTANPAPEAILPNYIPSVAAGEFRVSLN